MRADADVIITGAGPAGAATALLLARAGVDVLLLDRQEFPRAKPCGDCLSCAARDVLARLGVLDAVTNAPHAALRGWRIFAPDGAFFEAEFHDIAAHDAIAIERRRLDEILLDSALRAGARFQQLHVTDVLRDGGTVTGVRSRGGATLRARIVIGADGLRSVLATRLGAVARPPALRKLSLTFHIDTRACTDRFGEMHVGPDCCAGLAPVTPDGGRCNLTLVMQSATQPVRVDAHQLARRILARLPALRARISDDTFIDAPFLASGPFDRPMRRIVFDGAALAGDAAGYYDPFTGQGVFQALSGAERLAPVVLSALDTGDVSAPALAPYAAARAADLRGTRLVQRGVEAVLSRPGLAVRAIRRMQHAASFRNTLLAVTGDVARPGALLSPRAVTSLLSF